MKTTGVFVVHQYKTKPIRSGETLYLLPFGDVHQGSPHHHKERWAQFLKWAKAKENALFIGMGDYFDIGSSSDRLILNDGKMHDSTRKQLEELYRDQAERFANSIRFMTEKNRLIGLIEGNHYAVLGSGLTTTQYLCELLRCKYLGVSSFVRLSVPRVGSTGNQALDIWAHHGKASGRLAGATINNVQRMMDIAEADIFLCGHDHQKAARIISRLQLKSGRQFLALHHKKILLARTGSFLKGYVDGEPSYIADAAYSPTDLGIIKIELTLKRERKDEVDDTYIDIHASV